MANLANRRAKREMIRRRMADTLTRAILERIPPLTEKQARVLRENPALRERVMKEFGDQDLFFAWLKQAEG